MGNPNGDLFIKTISWMFVVPASIEGATSYHWYSVVSPLPFYLLKCDTINLHSEPLLTGMVEGLFA